MPSIDIDGFQISYQQRGNGPPLLFLHSIFTDWRIWEHQLADFEHEYSVIAWDAPGCGGSALPPARWDMTHYAEMLIAFLQGIGASSAHIAGAAWGSTLALELWRLRPDLVRSLVLASAYAGWKGSLTAEEIARRLDRFELESGQPPETFIGSWIPTFVTPGASKETIDAIVAMMRDLHPEGSRIMAAALAECDHRASLPDIAVPVLVINGEGDRRAPLAVAQAIHQAIPGSELQIVAGAGHLPYLERPQVFNEAVRTFLAKHS